MKKNLILTICILFCWAVQAQKLDTISFSIDKVELCEVNGYTRVSLNSCSTTDEIGFPELPRLELKYILPYNSQITSIIVTDSTRIILASNVVVYPKQPDYPISDTSQHAFVNPIREIYENAMPYPRRVELLLQNKNRV